MRHDARQGRDAGLPAPTPVPSAMHVALIHSDIGEPRRGGICTLYLELGRALCRQGIRVTLIGTRVGTSSRTHPETIGIDADVVDDAYREKLAEVLRSLAPDIVECSSWGSELLAYAELPSACRAPVVVRGDLTAHTLGNQELARTEQQMLGRCDLVIAVSRYAANDIERAYGVRCGAVVLNGVNPTVFQPRRVTALDPERTRPRVVWVGKPTEMKGWDLLTRMIPMIVEHADVVLLLGRAHVEPVLDDLPKPEVSVISGIPTDELPHVFHSADYVLSTSRWEGFGLSILEAVACGRTVIIPAGLVAPWEYLRPHVDAIPYDDPSDVVRIIREGVRLTPPPVSTALTWEANAVVTAALYGTVCQARRWT